MIGTETVYFAMRELMIIDQRSENNWQISRIMSVGLAASTGRRITSHMVTNRGLNFRLRGWSPATTRESRGSTLRITNRGVQNWAHLAYAFRISHLLCLHEVNFDTPLGSLFWVQDWSASEKCSCPSLGFIFVLNPEHYHFIFWKLQSMWRGLISLPNNFISPLYTSLHGYKYIPLQQ
jgi:hypothetical protein